MDGIISAHMDEKKVLLIICSYFKVQEHSRIVCCVV